MLKSPSIFLPSGSTEAHYNKLSFAGPVFAIQSSPNGALSVALSAGDNIISTLSTRYLTYSLAIGGGAHVSSNDINAIYQWVQATDISIADNQDIPHKLSQNPEKLQDMVELQRLAVTVTETSYATLRLANFMNYLPNIHVIQVGVSPLRPNQVQEFIANQGELNGWDVRLMNEGKAVVFGKYP